MVSVQTFRKVSGKEQNLSGNNQPVTDIVKTGVLNVAKILGQGCSNKHFRPRSHLWYSYVYTFIFFLPSLQREITTVTLFVSQRESPSK